MMRFLWAFALVAFLPLAAMAQDEAVSADMQKRLELARQMHIIKPVYQQVEAVVTQIVRNVPPEKQEEFVNAINQSVDNEKLEKISVEAMAETFTAAELEKMVAYFGSDEAKSITEKLPVYQAIVEPEIQKMMDAALMKLRTGAPADEAK
ncbi:MAG: DUF2059 domain-containing protein [Rhodospirillales bacterium]|nr:DUF2059 domain-containing protein [Rhodospirillales bacterium]